MTPGGPLPPEFPADRYGTGMPPEMGALYYLSGLGLAFRKIRMEDHSAERIRRAAGQGPVVYAFHTPSLVDWLALNRTLIDRKLPLPVYTHGLEGAVFGPLTEVGRRLWERMGQGAPPDAIASGWLTRTVASGRTTCVFAGQSPDILTLLGLGDAPQDPFEALELAQQQSERAIRILPVVVLWERNRPEGVVGQFVEGLESLPGPLGKIWALANASDPLVQVGEPVSLLEFQQRFAAEAPGRRRKMLRLLVRRYLYRETQVVLGPRTRSWEEVRRQVLRSPEVRRLVAEEAARAGTSPRQLAKKVGKIYDRIAARFSGRYLRGAAWVTRQIWKRIYSGIDIRSEDLERIRAAMRNGTAILIPCHRSHLDYMLLSSILYDHDVAVPHIVAGDNLNFWPVGGFFRKMGAFFIRRSFGGDKLFPGIFARYLSELVKMEVPVEFFIEGGRSRTGKLLPPKLGVLSMIFDTAGQVRSDRHVSILPIYIGYARIAEEKVFGRELSGASKEPESVAGVVRASRVLMERYGRVYVRVGEPVDVREAAGAWAELSKEARQERVLRTARTVLSRIDGETLILPVALTALAVLAHGRRGIRHEDLLARAARFLEYLRSLGVKEPPGLRPVEALVEEAVRVLLKGRNLEAHEGDGSRVYSISPIRRIHLEYYKNSLLSPLASVSWYCAAIRALGKDLVDPVQAERLYLRQLELFRLEFVFGPEETGERLCLEARQTLLRWGLLLPDAEGLRVRDRSHVGELANLTTNFLESYQLVVRVLEKGTTDVPKAALALGKTLLAVDELNRPESLNLQNLQNAAAVLGGRPDLPAVKADLSLLLEGTA